MKVLIGGEFSGIVREAFRARGHEALSVDFEATEQPGPHYTGHSLVVGPAGELVAEVGDGDHVVTASIDTEELDAARTTNPSLLNRRF